MKTKINYVLIFGLSCMMMTALGCGTTQSARLSQLEGQISQKDQELKAIKSTASELKAAVRQNESELVRSEKANAELRAEKQTFEKELQRVQLEQKQFEMAQKSKMAEACSLFPTEAKAGECYAKVFIPAKYKTVMEKVLKNESSEKIEIIPAKYEWVEEKVLVKEASKKLMEIPARYQIVEEKILAKEAHQVWKKGSGPIEKVDNATGEIMCLVEIPASYKTVQKHVLKEPARVEEIEIPAQYKTVKVLKEINPADVKRIPIPEEYQTVSKTVKVDDEHMEWRRILCKTNVTPQLVSKLQKALLSAGHNPGPIDGVIGPRTNAAIKSYQQTKQLATGALTYETIESLNIR
ncbi:MAG: peptidoglycan-binding protein [Desulfobacterales bacterium]|nr:peptidoglycan-binding protein [Desulfobacterales bacterium]MDD4072055.1 peptidoglycan-binding protein [Desulfobacterales bacterium]MDD4393376.1 peptidoglycan-binding protein [Desulfobacterales bacterium]